MKVNKGNKNQGVLQRLWTTTILFYKKARKWRIIVLHLEREEITNKIKNKYLESKI